jgi:DNA-binding response OmpR family regulator
MRIAILEDEHALAEQIARVTTLGGHVSHIFHTGTSLITALKRDTFDLLILDWNLPDVSGVEVLVWAKENVRTPPPVLFITSRSDEADVIRALDLGADDYLVKPIQAGEMLARVRALLRRSFPFRPEDVQVFGRYSFDRIHSMVSVDGGEVQVTQKEFTLALLFFQNTNRALSRAYLLETVWGSKPDLQTRTLDAHVSRIRAKLGLRPEAGYRLAPVYSHGYRLEKFGDDVED